MNDFVQYAPTEVVFGREMEKLAGKQVRKWNGTRVMIVFGGSSAKKSGLLDRVEGSLTDAGVEYVEFGGVKPNPRLAYAEEGVKIAAAAGVDFILAVGGGSAIDTAKAIAHGTANPGKDLWDIWTLKTPLEKTLPVGVILTIPAAGSEMSNSAVLTNEAEQRKVGLSSDLNRVKFAIMNPELAFTLPRWQLICGIADIMMHTMERYFIEGIKCDLTDEIAEGLLRTVIANGRLVVKTVIANGCLDVKNETVIANGRLVVNDETDYDAMAEIMWASSISHNGLTGDGRGGDFSVHKIGHALSAAYDATHGASLTAVWGSWARYLYADAPKRFARYARNVWGVTEENDLLAAEAGIQKTVDYFREIGLPVSLAELLPGKDLSDEVLNHLAAAATLNDTVKLSRIRPLGQKEIFEILKAAM